MNAAYAKGVANARHLGYDAASGGSLQDIIFPANAPAPQQPAQGGPIPRKYATSTDNPLHIGFNVHPRPREKPPSPALPSGFAGKQTTRSQSVRGVLLGDELQPSQADTSQRHVSASTRTEYEHPSYQIRRSNNSSNVKDLLFASQQPQAPSTQPQASGTAEPPSALQQVYESLKRRVPLLPRDGEGNLSEWAMQQALAEHGLELSMSGVAELLARCDVVGFPAYEHFLGCLTREDPPAPPSVPPPAPQPAPQRAPSPPPPPPPLPEPSVEFQPPSVEESPSSALEGSVPPEAAAEPPPPQRSSLQPRQGETHNERTWRHLQLADELASVGTVAPPKKTMPLGMKSNVVPIGANVGDPRKPNANGRKGNFTQSFPAEGFYDF